MQRLTRKVGETIHIGEDIRITIVDADASQARFAVYDPNGRVISETGSREPDRLDVTELVRAPLISGNWAGGDEAEPQA